MARSIHITTARTMLNSGDPVDISVWKANGEILHLHNCISLRYDFYAGTRRIDLLSSGQILKKYSRLLHIPVNNCVVLPEKNARKKSLTTINYRDPTSSLKKYVFYN